MRLNKILFLLCFFLLGCFGISNSTVKQTPSTSYVCITQLNSNETWCDNHPRLVRVRIDPAFSAQQREWIISVLPYLQSFGIVTNVVDANHNVEIRRWYNNSQSSPKIQTCRNERIGEYHNNTNFVLVDPNCAHSQQQFMAVVEHEIGHWLGLRHICREDGRTTDVCSNIGRGSAIMNPYLDVDNRLNPSNLDLAEYDRVLINSCLQRQRR